MWRCGFVVVGAISCQLVSVFVKYRNGLKTTRIVCHASLTRSTKSNARNSRICLEIRTRCLRYRMMVRVGDEVCLPLRAKLAKLQLMLLKLLKQWGPLLGLLLMLLMLR